MRSFDQMPLYSLHNLGFLNDRMVQLYSVETTQRLTRQLIAHIRVQWSRSPLPQPLLHFSFFGWRAGSLFQPGLKLREVWPSKMKGVVRILFLAGRVRYFLPQPMFNGDYKPFSPFQCSQWWQRASLTSEEASRYSKIEEIASSYQET